MLHACTLSLYLTCVIILILVRKDAAAPIRYVSHKNCNNMAKGKIIPHPENCAQYIMCNGLRSTLGECPEGQYYNADMLSCDKLKAQCHVKVKPTKPSAVKVTEKTTINPVTSSSTVEESTQKPFNAITTTTTALPLYVDGRPLCVLWKDLKFPHPYHCGHYYQCVKGFLTIRRCYFGYIWDVKAQRCLPESIGYCPSTKRLKYYR